MSVGESLGIYNICIISPLFFHSLSQFLAPGSSPYTLILFLLETVIKTVSFIKHMLLAPSPDLQRATLKNWVGSGDEANMLYLDKGTAVHKARLLLCLVGGQPTL